MLNLALRNLLFLLLMTAGAHSLRANQPPIAPPSWQATGSHIGSRYQQLCAVNTEWHLHPQGLALTADAPLLPDNDALVQAHLLTVHALLAAAPTHHLSPAQAAKRAQLLHTLHTYAQAGAFPQNHHYARRTPIFVDDAGTHCAVGYLMHVDGRDDLVTAVRQANNLIYIRQIAHNPALAQPFDAWQQASGFSVAELALIQPGYPPTNAWDSLPMPANAKVHAILADPNSPGAFYVGGEFDITLPGGSHTYNLALWNGLVFEPISSGYVNGPVYALAYHNNKLAVGGAFSQVDGKPTANVALFDPTNATWQNLPDTSGPSNGPVYTLASFDGSLYAGGNFAVGNAANGQGNHFGRLLQDNTWQGYAFDGPVYATYVESQSFVPYLVVGGAFANVGSTPAQSLARLAAMGPTYTWSAYLGGIATTVRTITRMGNFTVVGGDLYDDASQVAPGFALYNGTGWDDLSNVLTTGAPNTTSEVRVLLPLNDTTLLVAGRFQYAPLIGTYGSNLVRVDFAPNGSFRDATGMIAEIDAPIHALGATSNHIYIGGRFNQINTKGAYGFARTANSPTGIDQPDTQAPAAWLAAVGPNPAPNGVLGIRFSPLAPARVSLQVLNLQGQTLYTAQDVPTDRALSLDLGTLPAGVYLYTLCGPSGACHTGRWVRQ